jgi:hypothetical protein
LCFLQTRRQRDAANRPSFLIFLPTRPGNVAADDCLNRQCFELAHYKRTVGYLASFLRLHERRGFDVKQVVRQHVAQLVEPEVGQGGKNVPLAGYRSWQHYIEGRQAIALDDEQTIVIHSVDVAHFTPVQQGQRPNVRFEQGGCHR